MTETDTGTGTDTDDWLRNTDGAIDQFCDELHHWLTEYQHRPEALVAFTLAIGGSQEVCGKEGPPKYFSEALATFFKHAYRDHRRVGPVLRQLSQQRLDTIQAGEWTTSPLPGLTHPVANVLSGENKKQDPQPASPALELSVEDLSDWQNISWKTLQTEENGERDGKPTHTDATLPPCPPPPPPPPAAAAAEKEKTLKHKERFNQGQEILRAQELFRQDVEGLPVATIIRRHRQKRQRCRRRNQRLRRSKSSLPSDQLDPSSEPAAALGPSSTASSKISKMDTLWHPNRSRPLRKSHQRKTQPEDKDLCQQLDQVSLA